ncbi:cyclase-associated protein, putative [Plasmodium malariae]|uniref:Cyclase-associated protein, putative n=1 Tax=Plasmodium malariae TaxID=5858 RepID=A0A1A8X759_PLAMA|nr:cyclase-associated protein, putative [Plasmodium malariae]SBT01094.1 cyclase-associated protein, putative (CAP) [Plasmodium malariae]SBT87139.1 cyclase-associated protein, putative [Plasmodium malariae]
MTTSEATINLKDNQWDVSNYKNEEIVKLNKVELNHAVNIFNCENSTIVIENEKFKSLQIQKCVKCNAVLKNLISSIEIIHSKNIKIQILGKCSSLSVDKSVGVQIYLSKENTDCEFTTALSSEMNIHLENAEGDWNEITIPEQFQHHLQDGKLSTRVSDLYNF